MAEPRKPLAFPRTMRLSGRRAFRAVFEPRVARRRGVLTCYGRPNGLPHCRLGLSVSRRVGKATVRNRVKRLLRESFRRRQHDLPPGYDLVVVVAPHAPAALPQYEAWLLEAAQELDKAWRRRQPSR